MSVKCFFLYKKGFTKFKRSEEEEHEDAKKKRGRKRLLGILWMLSVTYIGIESFIDCSPYLVFYVVKDSYAYEYALESGYKVREIEPVPATVGTELMDTTNFCKVKVNSTDVNKPTVTYVGSMNQNTKDVKIPSKVTIDGITYTVTSIADKKITIKVPKNMVKKCKTYFKSKGDKKVTVKKG